MFQHVLKWHVASFFFFEGGGCLSLFKRNAQMSLAHGVMMSLIDLYLLSVKRGNLFLQYFYDLSSDICSICNLLNHPSISIFIMCRVHEPPLINYINTHSFSIFTWATQAQGERAQSTQRSFCEVTLLSTAQRGPSRSKQDESKFERGPPLFRTTTV